MRDFDRRQVRPVVRELEHANTYPGELIARMQQLGLFGLALAEPWGSGRVSTSCFALVAEELAAGWMSLAGAIGGHTVVASLLQQFGTAEQRDRYLPAMSTTRWSNWATRVRITRLPPRYAGMSCGRAARRARRPRPGDRQVIDHLAGGDVMRSSL